MFHRLAAAGVGGLGLPFLIEKILTSMCIPRVELQQPLWPIACIWSLLWTIS